MKHSRSSLFVSRGGNKLAAALDHFKVNVTGSVCADLGSHVGGFVDCLLQRGAARVYSIDTGYGVLAWKLRRDPRVVVVERTNAMHVSWPDELINLVTIDVGWTPQAKILPNVARLIDSSRSLPRSSEDVAPAENPGRSVTGPPQQVVTLIKPHYEAGGAQYSNHPNGRTAKRLNAAKSSLIDGVLPDRDVDRVVIAVLQEIAASGWIVLDSYDSPLRGHGGNREVFALLTRQAPHP